MADLKALYESLGLSEVKTYIQSGNVIFKTDEKDLQTTIEKAIESKYGFFVPVIVKTIDQLQEALNNSPFNDEDFSSQILFSFLSKPISDTSILEPYKHESETFFIKDDIFYLFCPKGYGKTKLSNTLLEKKFSLRSTTRNLKTITKLLALSKST